MKLERISNTNQTKRTRKNSAQNSQVKQDLTSFGAVEQNATNVISSKKSSVAIKNNFLSGISFKGQTEMINHKIIGTAGAIAIGREPNSYNDTYGTIEQKIGAHRLSHANSSIERTNNAYKTDRVYYADPEEVVSSQTKKDHDYIVYDNRPKYPRLSQVRENYFNTERDAENYGQYFKTVAEYYYRLEMADKRELGRLQKQKAQLQQEYDTSAQYKQELDEKSSDFPWQVDDINKDKEKADYFYYLNSEKYNAIEEKIGYYNDRINHSKQQQKKAIQAFKIFDEVGLLFMERDGIRNRLRGYNGWEMGHWQSCINDYTKKLNNYSVQKESLEKELKIAKEWKALNDSKVNAPSEDFSKYPSWERYDKEREDKEERADAKAESEKFAKKINIWEDKLNKINLAMSDLQKRIDEAQNNLDRIKEQIPELERRLKEKSEEIKTYYPKMEEFYNNNIEEWQY